LELCASRTVQVSSLLSVHLIHLFTRFIDGELKVYCTAMDLFTAKCRVKTHLTFVILILHWQQQKYSPRPLL